MIFLPAVPNAKDCISIPWLFVGFGSLLKGTAVLILESKVVRVVKDACFEGFTFSSSPAMFASPSAVKTET